LAGNFLIVLGTFLWGFDNVVSAGLARRSPPWSVATWKNLIGASAVLAGALLFGLDFGAVGANLPALLLIGCVGTGVSLTLYYVSLRHLDAYRTSAVFGLQGMFGAAGGFVLLGERLSIIQLAATALMIGAVVVLAVTHRADPAPPPPANPSAPPPQ
jgi:drug/metabolite transporter (DMT)-like permease